MKKLTRAQRRVLCAFARADADWSTGGVGMVRLTYRSDVAIARRLRTRGYLIEDWRIRPNTHAGGAWITDKGRRALEAQP